MKITTKMEEIRSKSNYIPASVHYSRRAFDKQFEIVARVTDRTMDELGVNIGGEVCLDVQRNRQDALAAVRFFRHQKEI
ncbi:hypothetical protein J1C56_02480 [Aminobacter anthyllidis]|uniref:Uncharacterized protein n=1 Tax=Aminobacter anthyllidis TaxID=1035067 RepID=A0A9X1A7F0_9HYPH|nr:hypothetical protein [Aminobacter anthyllidis]MBT1154451.1 hypothetical protein [Aminobacter anthyllidis]